MDLRFWPTPSGLRLSLLRLTRCDESGSTNHATQRRPPRRRTRTEVLVLLCATSACNGSLATIILTASPNSRSPRQAELVGQSVRMSVSSGCDRVVRRLLVRRARHLQEWKEAAGRVSDSACRVDPAALTAPLYVA